MSTERHRKDYYWPIEMREAPHLVEGQRVGPPRPKYALLINPFYAKDPHASLGKHVLTPSLALTSLAGATPRHVFCGFLHHRGLAGRQGTAADGAGRPWPTAAGAWLGAPATAAAVPAPQAQPAPPGVALSPLWCPACGGRTARDRRHCWCAFGHAPAARRPRRG